MRQALAEGADVGAGRRPRAARPANGLHPAALADGGLAAALDDMARHSPVPLRVQVEGDRLDPGTEFTAWSVIGEAVVNAQKHAAAHGIEVDVRAAATATCGCACTTTAAAAPTRTDPGCAGCATASRPPRAGSRVTSGADGTTVEAVLPCGS